MSLSFPLSAATFADLLDLESAAFNLVFQQEASNTGSGELLVSDLAPAYWEAEFETIPLRHADAYRIMALINSLGGGLRTFFMYNPALSYPQADPDGTLFGAAMPLVGTVTDSHNLSFTAFPANYEITAGDFFTIVYGTPDQIYLGQFVESITANSSGVVASVAVSPALPAGVATSDSVTMMKPYAKFKIIPNTAYVSTLNPKHQKIKFSARQTKEAG